MAPLHARPGTRAAAHDAATAAHHAKSAEAAYAELVLKTNRDADVSAESLSELLMECAGALSVSASDANAGTADEEAILGNRRRIWTFFWMKIDGGPRRTGRARRCGELYLRHKMTREPLYDSSRTRSAARPSPAQK